MTLRLELKPYLKYKESGVPWLGRVPEGWEHCQIRRVCRVFSGGTPDKGNSTYWANGQIPWLSSGEVNGRRIFKARQHITAKGLAGSSAKWIPARSVLVALAGQGKTKGMVATLEFPSTCNQSLAALCPDSSKIHYGFLAYYLEGNYLNVRGLVGNGLRDGLNLEIVKAIEVPLPSPSEQCQIDRTLTQLDCGINRFIRAKRRLIELLNEQKQAIIHQAVTRGLDPRVRMKPSGVDWIGDVPDHWDVSTFGKLSRVIRGASPRPAGEPKLFAGTYMPWVTVGEVTRDEEAHLEHTATCLTEAGARQSRFLDKGTLIITNSGATLGVPKILSIDACANDGIVAFARISERVRRPYAYHYLSTLTQRIRSELRRGGTQPNLNTTIVRALGCPLPPTDEQDRIVAFVDRISNRIRRVCSLASREISLLREYRTRLIADVVTGKLDVRGVELPAGADVVDDELEGIDEEAATLPEDADDAGASGDETEADVAE